MTGMDRRTFLKVAGIGSMGLPAAAAAGPIAGSKPRNSVVTFRASTGLPAKPLPAWATQVIEGSVDTATGTGLLTSRLVAGHPGDPSEIALPGLSRVLRVTTAHQTGTQLQIDAIVDDRSQLRPGEDPHVRIVVDQLNKVVHAPFIGQPITLQLEDRAP
jgi:hypothetical protein